MSACGPAVRTLCHARGNTPTRPHVGSAACDPAAPRTFAASPKVPVAARVPLAATGTYLSRNEDPRGLMNPVRIHLNFALKLSNEVGPPQITPVVRTGDQCASRSTRTCLRQYALASIGIALAGISVFGECEAQDVPLYSVDDVMAATESLMEACDFNRKPLQIRTVVQSSITGADATWSQGGWIALDADSLEVVLLGADGVLRDYRPVDWSMTGVPPAILSGREVGFINDRRLRLLGSEVMYPIFGDPDHALADELGQVVYESDGTIFRLDLDSGATSRILTTEDFGMVVDEENGLPPEASFSLGLDGALYIAWDAQSSIWKVENGAPPTLVVQRCVPEELLLTHVHAPRLSLTIFGYPEGFGSDSARISVASITDFVVLESGEVLVMGALDVGPNSHRSIELYGTDGIMKHAWELPVPAAVGRFDPTNPRRILLRRRRIGDDIDRRLVLLELQGERYPG